ncbi:MAG: hypothetical protein KF865_12955 [Bdellovibrionaceae bacterium]|nr:hypothetical protein [Pseudobdellovibrionaceae bacterium]
MMKNALIALLIGLLAEAALAATTVNLAPRPYAEAPEGRATSINLTTELRRQKIGGGADTARLVQVDLRVKTRAQGAMVALLLNGKAIDSRNIPPNSEQSITLNAATPPTAQPWVLGYRGGLQILDLSVTVDSAEDPRGAAPGTAREPAAEQIPPEEPDTGAIVPGAPADLPQSSGPVPSITPREPAPGGSGGTGELPPPSSPNGVPADELFNGQRVIAVSRSSGRIDYVTVVRRDPRGTYTVFFEGQEYHAFERHQLAVAEGCAREICAGARVLRRDSGSQEFKVLGLLPQQAAVLEDPRGQRFVLPTSELIPMGAPNGRAPGSQRPPPQQGRGGGRPQRPAPNDPSPEGGRRWQQGQVALLVDPSNRVFPVRVQGADQRGVAVTSMDGRWQQIIPDDGRIGVLEGCAGGYCVGEVLTVVDSMGRVFQAEMIGVQNERMVILRLREIGVEVGNWPVGALRR